MTAAPEQSRGVLDTSIFIAVETGRTHRRDLLPIASVTTVITFAELSAGVLSAIDPDQRAQRLRTLTRAASLPLLAVNTPAAQYWAQLRVYLAASSRRVNVNDLWIAAIALAHALPIVTRDDDFDALQDFPGLELIKV